MATLANPKVNVTSGLSDAMVSVRSQCAVAGKGLTKFAETVLVLMDVTTQLAELDEARRQAGEAVANENAEARKWREISAQTMKMCRDNLVAQQLRTIEVLEDLSSRGGSIVTEAEQGCPISAMKKKPMAEAPPLPPPGIDYASKHIEVESRKRKPLSKRSSTKPAMLANSAYFQAAWLSQEWASDGLTSGQMLAVENVAEQAPCMFNMDGYSD